MAYTPRDNSGSLFKNDKKTEDKHPDYTGTATINGEDFFMDAWIKKPTDPAKKTFMSFAFKRKNKQSGPQQPQSQQQERPPARKPAPPARDPDLDPEPDKTW